MSNYNLDCPADVDTCGAGTDPIGPRESRRGLARKTQFKRAEKVC